MNDDDHEIHADHIHTDHWCEHPGCKQWGAFGMSRPPSTPPRWFCSEHRPPEWYAVYEQRRG